MVTQGVAVTEVFRLMDGEPNVPTKCGEQLEFPDFYLSFSGRLKGENVLGCVVVVSCWCERSYITTQDSQVSAFSEFWKGLSLL